MSTKEYREKIGIPEDHNFVLIDSSSKQKRGRDTDYYTYEHRSPDGALVATYEVEDEMEIYPPQKRHVRWSKVARSA